MSLRERFAAAIGGFDEADPRSSSGGVIACSRRATAERVQPTNRELERYWRLYETVPLIRAIDNQEQSTLGHGSARYTREYAGAFDEGFRTTAPDQTLLAIDTARLFDADLGGRSSTRSGFSPRSQTRERSSSILPLLIAAGSHQRSHLGAHHTTS